MNELDKILTEFKENLSNYYTNLVLEKCHDMGFKADLSHYSFYNRSQFVLIDFIRIWNSYSNECIPTNRRCEYHLDKCATQEAEYMKCENDDMKENEK